MTRRGRLVQPSKLKQNESAQDLWRQVLAQLSRDPYATLQDPNYDPSEDDKKIQAAMREVGWLDEQIVEIIKIHQTQVENAPTTSPGVNPHAEFIFNILCDDVEAAMGRLGMSSHARVARGLEPRLGPYAAKTNVIMTEESIVTVGTQLFRFCGLIARAFIRTVQLDANFWDSDRYSKKAAIGLIRAQPELLAYWIRIYTSYALTGVHILVPFRPASIFEVSFEHVTRAMELFAVAHEYGHHHYNHGRQIDPQIAKAEEFEADQFALKICYEAERDPDALGYNPYMTSGAGGLILLRALRSLHTVENRLNGTPAKRADSHPDAEERAARFETIALLRPSEYETLQHFRRCAARVLDAVDTEIARWLDRLTPAMMSEIDHWRWRPGS